MLHRIAIVVGLAAVLWPASAAAQRQSGVRGAPPAAGQSAARALRLDIVVTDENGVAVPHAQITAENATTHATRNGETDSAGRFRLSGLAPGAYRLSVNCPGFYALTTEGIDPASTGSVEIAIHHHQPVGEVVNVTDVAPGIDPQQTAKSETLQSRDIVNIPYPTTRDVRNVLTYIPGVVQDQVSNQVHIAGAAAYQTDYVLDNFIMNQPVTGTFALRISPDSVRTIEVESSRYSAQYGRASGGVLALDTRTGDDNFRFSFVNFLPTFQNTKHLTLNNWVPRATFGGPLRKQRAWFYLSQDAEVDNVIVKELPDGADRNLLWRVGDLAKLQVNITPGNVITTSFVYNYLDSPHSNISVFTPQSATVNNQSGAWMFTVRDQQYLSRTMIETGVAVTEFRDAQRPQGNGPFLVLPNSVAGNYYRDEIDHSRRLQGIANVYFPPAQWMGKHDLRFGLDFSAIDFREQAHRGPTLVYDNSNQLIRQITFVDRPEFTRSNIESGIWGQDRWSPADRLIVEGGLRIDRDQIVPRIDVAPRLAASYTLTRNHQTKLSAGAGVFYDQTRLDFFARPFAGAREDLFYTPGTTTPLGPAAVTTFHADQRLLRSPRFLNYSVGLERMLPWLLFSRFEFIDRHGVNGFTFVNQSPNPGGPGGAYLLTNQRSDHYDAFQVTLRRDFKNGHALLGSYTRSAARTNRALEFTLDNPTFGLQGPGRLPWDSPNRVISWGWLPMPFFRRTDFAYSMEWRTGFPFNVVNNQQALVGTPGHMRFPSYFTLNPAVEHIFHLLGYQFALRGGIDNITGRKNPVLVNNNIESPQFLTFEGTGHRTFNGRIRFLGKK